MKIVDRYLGITVLNATLLVMLVLVGLDIVINLIQELGDVGTGEYHLLAAFNYVLLDLPNQIYLFFPMASLLGVLLGLGALAGNNELIILRAGGMSLIRITQGVMIIGLVILAVATVIGEVIAPVAEHKAESYKAILTNGGQTLQTEHGVWVRDGRDFLYIRSVFSGKRLEGVSRYQFDNNNNLTSVSYAKNGFYAHGRWVMQNILENQINTNQVTTQQIPQADWQLSVDPNLLNISTVDANEMSLVQLYDYLTYLKANDLNARDYALSFWQRITQPLATLVMMWLAIPFVFGPLRSATMGLRILAGAVLGFSFYTLNQFFGPVSVVYQLPPFIAAILPSLLFAVGAYYLQRRVA